MANNEYAIRFSETKYATKQEVAKDLNIGFIDSIWSIILAYRTSFYQYLPIKSIERSQLFVCQNNYFDTLQATCEEKLITVNNQFNSLSGVNGEKQYFRLLSKMSSLKFLNQFKDFNLLEKDIKDIVNRKDPNLGLPSKSLVDYLSALDFIEDHVTDEIDEQYTANLYQRLTGQEELTYFYRMEDINNPNNSVQVNRLYYSAPSSLIDGIMQTFYSFIEVTTLHPIAQALLTYYYIDYIKPFSSKNEEMAILLCKAILANREIGEISAILPIEKLIIDRIETSSKIYNEVQKTQDVTYFIIYAFKFLISLFDEMNNKIKTIENNKPEVKVEKPVEKPVIKEEIKVNEVKEEIKVIKDISEFKKEEVEVVPNVSTPSLAVSYIPEEIDEKTARRLASHLLECDPELKKGEAKFYSKHCTLGKIYTIQQYKKEIGCVYETARTSMDHLAKLGYYQEFMIKNKKVYTPVKRK